MDRDLRVGTGLVAKHHVCVINVGQFWAALGTMRHLCIHVGLPRRCQCCQRSLRRTDRHERNRACQGSTCATGVVSKYMIHGRSHKGLSMSARRCIPVRLFLSVCSATKQRQPSSCTLLSLRSFAQQSSPAAPHRAVRTTTSASEPFAWHLQNSAMPTGQLSAVPIVHHEVRLVSSMGTMLCIA